jgi:hypothetical protein
VNFYSVLFYLQTNTYLGFRSGFGLRARHGNLATRRVRQSSSENLNALLGDKQRVLELRRPAAVRGDTRPVVGPRLVLVGAESNHGLDGEAHARLRLADSLVLGVVRDVGGAVEELVDAVAAVSFHDAAVAFLGDLFDRVAVVAEEGAGFDELD